MQLIKTIGPVSANNNSNQPAYTLEPNETYALYDNETAAAMRSETVHWVATLDARLPNYAGQSLTNERLVLPFIGRLGDALITAACLKALRDTHPNITIDIACLPASKEVFQLTPTLGELLTYPLRADQLDAYNYHLSFEDIASIPNATRRSLFDLFSTCLNTPRPNRPVSLNISESVETSSALPPTQQQRVAIHVGEPDSLRTYPLDLTINLANELCNNNIEVILFGSRNAQPTNINENLAPQVQNRIGKTTSIADLAATLQQMDAIITGDSFPLHLAAALNIKTVALFAPTNSAIATDYSAVTTIESQAKCSPCGVAFGPCPIAHPTCIAHNDESLAPKRIATQVVSLIQEPAHQI
jgi:ADP-heptose:LPS heptosyltransferase